MKFKLSKYIIPAIISMVVVGTNANIDGFFIGQILGDDGLAAINIAWPIVAFIASLGTGIGIGGAVILNRKRGEGDSAGAEEVKNTTICMLLAFGILVGALTYIASVPILKLMGADGAVLEYANSYSSVISAGAVFQVVAAGLLVLLRNDEKTYASMIYSLVGLILHLVLNFLLAEGFVMSGVAASTVISQGVIMILGFISIMPKKSAKPRLNTVPQILVGSLAPFGINFVPSLVLMFTNAAALKWGGVAAVSAYAAMSYAVYTFDYVFQGICDGIQPIISYCYGANDKDQERHTLKCAGITLGGVSVLCIILTPVLIKLLPPALGVSGSAADIIVSAFWIYAVSYPFKAAVKFLCSYYYATQKQLLSNILVYLDPLLFTPLSLFLLTMCFGSTGVWLSMPISQILLSLVGVAVIMAKHKIDKKKNIVKSEN